MAKVSILIPVYNVENYIEQCLESVIAQTLKDIEIICVNDGSTDFSLDILKKYAVKDSRIKIINKENGGLPSARNAGLDAATGEYISFVDSDDYVQSNMMSVLYKNAKKTKAEIVICGANVFPETPRADSWFYQALSPERKFYEVCSDELLFENRASRPFIWRIFVKRDLIERNHFRLDENIHIGEDNAFQFKIYPFARGIAMIPDKLYNYRWYREDSMMNMVVYKDVKKKALSHIKMVLHVADEWIRSGRMEEYAFGFLRWSVEFIYDDFIRLPLKYRVEQSRLLADMWTECGYYRYKSELSDYIVDMFQYFYFMSKQVYIRQNVSIVMSADRDYTTLEKSIKSCLEQNYEAIELIIVNNSVSNDGYCILQKYLFKDKRVRIINFPKCHFTEGYNKVLNGCVGEYVHFILPNVWYESKESLKNCLVDVIKRDSDVLISPSCFFESAYTDFGREMGYIGNADSYFVDASIHSALFKLDYILDNKLQFGNYSIESGSVFMAKCCLNTDNVCVLEKAFCIGERQYVKDGISTEGCVLVLKSFEERLRLSEEFNSPALQKKVFSLLTSNYYTNILFNNTLPYWLPDHECPEGSNSQYEAIGKMMEILSHLDPDVIGEGSVTIPLLFRKIVDGRHKFVAQVSDEYCELR